MAAEKRIPHHRFLVGAVGLAFVIGGCDWSLIVGQPRVCGGLAGLPCREGEYCNFEDGSCGAADQTGECTEIPNACTLEIALVCGCDGQTYSNPCAAATVGVSVVREGACGQACGGPTDAACLENEYCQHAQGDCDSGETPGECRGRPEVCAEIAAPVCGCDGQTYGNECEAQAAGVNIRSTGACADDGGNGPG